MDRLFDELLNAITLTYRVVADGLHDCACGVTSIEFVNGSSDRIQTTEGEGQAPLVDEAGNGRAQTPAR